ncbi:MucBP domain-containing protein [Companilactobacillus sp. HBUAS56275]|uniref:MucBP domain-containing protein n=1 Tax=Candidatus Companilactobacillus pullicola TaxID=2838523 RepID=A0A9D1ZR21_9LACO|nr:MucBP domain-containing protein [Candidatus Companilactobacillus pullicola]
MNFKKQRLNKALEDKIYRVKLVHSKKGWLTVGLTFITLLGFTALGGKTVDASTTNNVAIAKAAKGNYVQLWSDVTSNGIHKTNRALGNGTAWKTAASVKGVDGETYLLVGGNEYANVKDMALQNETSSQGLLGVVHTRTDKKITRLYGDPTQGAKLITNRALGRDTYWKTDKKVVVNGETYYRVATNEWVKAEDAYLTGNSNNGSTETNQNNNNSGSTTGNTNHNNGGTTTPTTQKATIIVHHVKADGTKFGDDETFTREVGSIFDAQSRDTTGWMPEKMTQTITVHKGTNEVTFVYHQTKEGNIKVNYVDEKGNSIADSDNQSGYYGANVPVNAKDIDGYTLIGAKSQTVKVSENGNTVTFKYKKNAVTPKTATVTLNYLDAKGNVIRSATTTTAEVNTTRTFSAPTIGGYRLNGEASQSIKVNADNNVINFEYDKEIEPVQQSTITTRYVDANGTDIADPLVKKTDNAKPYTSKSKDVEGYTLDGDDTQTIKSVTGDKTLVFKYTKNATKAKAPLTIQLLSADTGYVVGNGIERREEIGKKVTVDAPDVLGYDIVGPTQQTVTISGKGGIYADTIVTFKYRRNETKMKQVISQLNAELYKIENEFRAEHNVPPLELNSDLQAGAEARAAQIVYGIDQQENFIGHEQPDGSDFRKEPHLAKYVYEHSGVGENIGMNGSDGKDISQWARHIFNTEIGDEEHADNALDPNYVAGGFAVGISSNGTVYGVQDFGM